MPSANRILKDRDVTDCLRIEGAFSEEDRTRADAFICETFYNGSLEADQGHGELRVHIDQIASRPCSISVLRSFAHLCWRRTWAHIRRDSADFCVVRLLRHGRATITHLNRTASISAGDLILTRSNAPLTVDVRQETGSIPHEMVILLIPSALCSQYLDLEQVLNRVLPRSSRHHGTACALIDMLSLQGAHLDAEAAELIGKAMVKELAALAMELDADVAPRPTLPEARLADIREKITIHFSNPNLSLDMIARKCGISPRYVTSIMSKFGTSFHDEVTKKRLNAAREIIRDRGKTIPINQVSFHVGFKSPSHFSSLFKKEFGHSPRSERA